MILALADVITADEQAQLLDLAASAPFVDGRETAGVLLSDAKRNEQVSRTAPAMSEVTRIVRSALQRNTRFQCCAIPKHVHSVRLARYKAGMHYRSHVDAALMYENDQPMRADVSFTIFLNAPDEYQGGELCLETGSGELRCKLPARCMICYPTGQLHQVRDVCHGQRLVAIGWVHSCVRDGDSREILGDLGAAMELVHCADGKSRGWDLLVKSHANLLRRWSEP